jgi:FACT complex subunit SPT16 N-terminal lobe domain
MTHGPYVAPLFSLPQQTDRVIQRAGKNDDYSAIADVDAIFLAAGEDEPVRKGTAFQVLCPHPSVPSRSVNRDSSRRHGFLDMSFPPRSSCFRKTRFISFVPQQKVSLHWSCDSLQPFLILSSARILEQLQKHRTVVPVEIFTLAKSKDPPTDAIPRFLSVFTSCQRIGSLTKETYAGKLIDEWNNVLAASNNKPEVVDIASSISTFMSVKDDEELASLYVPHPFHSVIDVRS